MIGILGGAGPVAGFDLFQKLVEETIAGCDQEHLPVILLSEPEKIPDRTDFLEGLIAENPAVAMSRIFLDLEKAGATVAAIPCNTAHTPAIFDETLRLLEAGQSNLKIVNLISATIRFIQTHFAPHARVGVLSTTGTWKRHTYTLPLEEAGFEVLSPTTLEAQERIHQAIYHPVFGIKATGTVVSDEAQSILQQAAQQLVDRGAEVIILGCTEIPLALTAKTLQGVPLIDTLRLLARALIYEYAPDKLKTFSVAIS